MLWRSILALALASVSQIAQATTSQVATATFDNNKRLLFDSNGAQIDAYGAKVQRFNGQYYLYGNSFSKIGTASGVKAYSSQDLTTWKFEGNILTSNLTATCDALASAGGCGRPHMLYNAKSSKYVLWLNGGSNGYLVATASSPTGPFNMAANRASIDPAFSGLQPADFAIESDGTNAWLVFSALNFRDSRAGSIWPPIFQTLHISPLTSDFMNTTGVSYPVTSSANDLIDQETESPDLFQRDGYFYVSASNTCGYCNGSIGLLYRSKTIKGPWTRQIIAADSCEGQVEGVAPLTNPSNNAVSYVWHSTSVPGGPRTGFGGHIFQPLSFNKDGSVADLNCADTASFSVSFQKGNNAVTSGAALSAGDATPAHVEYNYVCDSDQFDLFQTWTASKTGTLKSVSVNVARGSQSVPLSLTVFNKFTSYTQLVSPEFKWNALGSASVTPGNLSYTFDTTTVSLGSGVSVKKGDYLGLAISGQDFSPYCHLEWNTTGNNAGFKLFQRGAGHNSWMGLAGKRSPVYERVGKSVKFFATYA